MNDLEQPAPHPFARVLRPRNESGAALVEFALVVGLFFMLLYGIIAYGMAIGVKQNVNHAAFTGARAAVGASDPIAAAETAANDVMSEFAGGYTATAETRSCDPLVPGPQCIWVTVDYDYANHPVVPEAPGLGVVLPNTLQSTAVVQI